MHIYYSQQFLHIFSISSAPPSWQPPKTRSRSPARHQSDVPKPTQHSNASPGRGGEASRMRRFQKSTAIYTLPIRGKRRRSVISSTGKLHIL